MAECCTDVTLGNLGKGKKSIMNVTQRSIFIPAQKADGSTFTVPIATLKSLAAMLLLIQAVDPKDRIYPTPDFENVTDLRADSVFQEYTSGVRNKIRRGIRTFIGFHIAVQPVFLGKLEDYECAGSTVLHYDIDGNIIYNVCPGDDTVALGIPVENLSFDPVLIKRTDSEQEMMKVEYDYKKRVRDQDLRLICRDDLDYDPLDDSVIDGLIDGSGVVTVPLTTGYTVALTDCFGCVISGLLLADFSVFNDTDDANEPITSVTETPAKSGSYDVVYTTPVTASDLLTGTVTAEEEGYDVVDHSIVTPS